ncbi:MAG: serine protease, partial [Clostridia bacterium]|nr:serine protease [Clostridia bacterium]
MGRKIKKQSKLIIYLLSIIVITILSFIGIEYGTTETIGNTMPINIVKPIIESYRKNDNFEEAYIGMFSYDKEVIPYLDSNVSFDNGIYVVSVNTSGPAYNAGIRQNDIIVKIDGKEQSGETS